MNHQLLPPDGVPLDVWQRLAQPDGNRWAIKERDASGEVTGIAHRYLDGKKGFVTGGHRGLILEWPLPSYAGTSERDPILVVEGASDTATLMHLGFVVVGVPMAGHAGAALAELLTGLHVTIFADADTAGRNGANKIAGPLLEKCLKVSIAKPPKNVKDARAALLAGATQEDFVAEIAAAEHCVVKPKPRHGAPILVRLSEVQPEAVRWLWKSRIAFGKLSLIAGDPGLGKSLTLLDLAARLSSGRPMPNDPSPSIGPRGVVLLSAEDDIADTVRPRLDAAGADHSRIIALQGVQVVGHDGKPGERGFDLSLDLPALEEAFHSVEQCGLVIVDPVGSFTGDINSHNNAEVRAALAPLSALAARYAVAVAVITHLNKHGSGPAVYRAMGSLAFAAAARSVWGVVKDKDSPERRLFLPVKNNLATDVGGLAYRVERYKNSEVPIIAWEPDTIDMSADDAMASDNGTSSAVDEAKEWLLDVLCEGPVAAKDVKERAEADGIKSRTLDRAKKALHVRADREGYASEGRWLWALPHSAPKPPKDANAPGQAHYGEAGAQCEEE